MRHDHPPARPFAFFGLFGGHLRALKHGFADARLDNLSDESLKDIGVEPYRRDFDTVKPFWMP